MRVLVTRPAAQAAGWVQALRTAGLAAESWPLIEVVPAGHDAVCSAWGCWPLYDAAMFVSANAVDYFFAQRPPGLGPPHGARPRCWVTGGGSRDALLRHGVPQASIDLPADDAAQWDSEALWRVVAPSVTAGFRLLIVRGTQAEDATASQAGVGRDWFAQQVQDAAGVVDFVVSYARRAPQLSQDNVAHLRQAAVDGSVWLFTSSEAVANLQTLMADTPWTQARCVVTHPRIAEAARAAGFGVVCVSRPGLEALLASIKSLA